MPKDNGSSRNVNVTFQIVDITWPLLSVTKICEKGDLEVVCRQDAAYILDKQKKIVAKFPRKNGFYISTMDVKNPRHPGFTRPAQEDVEIVAVQMNP